MWTRGLGLFAVLWFLANGAAALAADPPGRVGRLSLIEGTVSLRSAETSAKEDAGDEASDEDWTPATLNYPVTSGNSLWTESGARAGLQVGAAELRMNERTELEIIRLDDRATQLALRQGTVNIHIGARQPGGLQLATPRGPVSIDQPGRYRIDVDVGSDEADDSVQLTVFDGEAQIAVGSEEKSDIHTVRRGQSTKLAGEPVDIVLSDARTTAFDDWARSRDPRAAQQPQALTHVSPQLTGYQDLDNYGTWAPAPDYGTVWYPTRVVDDWAPYRDGHWAYVAPWGWTWIDDAPWGFAPFHYGRWVQVGHRWAWWPGKRATRPIYAPALVAFVGGDGWSVGFGRGGARPVGWVPLAPHEVYRPHYRTSATYIRNVNITTVNTTVINNITVNKNKDIQINKFANRGAATVVSSDSFARGRKVNEARLSVPRKQIEGGRVSTDIRRIAPAAAESRSEQPRPTARNADARRTPDTVRAARDATPRMPSLPRQPVQMERAKESPAAAHSTPAAPSAIVPQAKQAAPAAAREERRVERRDRPAPVSPSPQAETAKEPAVINAVPTAVPQTPAQAQAATREERRNEGRGRPAATPPASAIQEQRVPRPDRREQRRAERSPTTQEQLVTPQAPASRQSAPQQAATPQPATPPEIRAPRPDRREQRREERPQQPIPAPQQSAPQQATAPQPPAAQETRAPRPERPEPRQEQRAGPQPEGQEQQQRRHRDQAEQQQRQAREQQQRVQAEQQQRAQAEQQQRQAQAQQQRAQAEQQQRQAQEQQQRAQAEQQQRQAQEQQRQQRDVQQQPQQSREQSRDESRRRGPDGRRDRAG